MPHKDYWNWVVFGKVKEWMDAANHPGDELRMTVLPDGRLEFFADQKGDDGQSQTAYETVPWVQGD